MKAYAACWILFFLVKTGPMAAATSAACYYPDGVTTDPNHVPCNSTLSTSTCCDPLDACTTGASGLCLGRTGFNYRGSCTDKSWTSGNCPSVCHADPSTKVAYNSWTALWSCNAPGAFQSNYCCDSPNKNCCTIATFDYGTTDHAFKPGMDQMLLELAAINTSVPVTVTVMATVTTTAAIASQTGSSSPVNSASSSSSNIGTAVGAGVGVPLGILALGILGFLFYRERRNSQYNVQQAGSASDIIELDPPKSYYAPQPQTQPPPPPQPQQVFVPLVEAQSEREASQLPTDNDRISTLRSPMQRNHSNVHELI